MHSNYFRKLWIGVALTLVMLLTIALANFVWRSYQLHADKVRDRQFYLQLDSILAEIQQAREDSTPNFDSIREQAKVVGDAINTAFTVDIGIEFPLRQALQLAARNDLPRLMQDDLATITDAEEAIARKVINASDLLDFSPLSVPSQDSQCAAALVEIERLGGIIARDQYRPIQPVTAITMKGNQFHDVHLAHLPNIVSLNIESAEITDTGLQNLRQIRSLKNCRLSCAKVTRAGIASLAALPALSDVHLYNCSGITDTSLLELKRVQRLVLFGSNITDQTLVILKEFPHLQQLMLGSDSLTDDGVASLANLPRLTTLRLSHCHYLSDVALNQILKIPNLETLHLQGVNITDAGLETVGKLSRLRSLYIFSCEDRMSDGLQITDFGLTRMKNLSTFDAFAIKGCPGITDDSVRVLQRLASLKILQLNETGITEKGHVQIASSLPSTKIDFTPTSPSPLDGMMTAPDSSELTPEQLEVSFRRWPVPTSQANPSGRYTIEEIENEYRANRKATDTKYDGQLIEVSGLVTYAGKNLEGDPTLWLRGSDTEFDVNCVLRSAKDLTNVAEGKTCRLRGVYCISIRPTFTHCTVINTTSDPITDEAASSMVDEGSDRQIPDVMLTAEQLEFELAADSQGAKNRYSGKVIQVTGRLSRISHVMMGAMRFHMGPALSTQYFLRTGDPWYRVRPGQTVTLVGKWFPTYPCLVNCEVIKVTGTPNSILTAVKLGEFLEADRAQFRKWFYLKQIIVTGEVIEKSITSPGRFLNQCTIKLRSTQNTNIVCEMDTGELRAADSVRIGDTVTIAGWDTEETPTDSVILVGSLFWRGK